MTCGKGVPRFANAVESSSEKGFDFKKFKKAIKNRLTPGVPRFANAVELSSEKVFDFKKFKKAIKNRLTPSSQAIVSSR